MRKTSVKSITPEVHSRSISSESNSRRSGESTERQQKGKQRSTKDKSVAIKQTSETIEAMKLEVATIIACDKKDKSDLPLERDDANAIEPVINIPATKVKAIKTATADEQKSIATSSDIEPILQQSKHKNQKHNNNITSNTCKTTEAAASNKQQHEESQHQSSAPSKKSKSSNSGKQAGKRGSINHRQNDQSLKDLHRAEQQTDACLVSASAQSTGSTGHRGYPSSHSSNNHNHHHHHHQNGSSSTGKSSTPQPVRKTNLIRQCRTKVATLLGRLVKNSLSSCSDTKFVTVLLTLFTCVASLLAMCIHSFIVAPVTD